MSWKPTGRSTTVDPNDLMVATPEYGSNLSIPTGLFRFVEKVTMGNDEDDSEFISYTFMSEDKNGNFQQKFSVTKFTGLWKVKSLIENGRIKNFVGKVADGTIHFQAWNFEEYDKIFAVKKKEEMAVA